MRESSKVVIVEDDSVVAAHVAQGIDAHPALLLAHRVASIAAARAVIASDIALFIIDLGLPDGSGIDLIGEIRGRLGPAPSILVLTMLGDQESVIAAIMAGADGYLLKDPDATDIAQRAADAVAGGAPLSPSIASYVLRHLRAQQGAPPGAPAEALLSPRELELLRLFARGYGNKQAAAALSLSPHTIGDYVKSIYRKLRVGNRGEAVTQAFRQGLLRS